MSEDVTFEWTATLHAHYKGAPFDQTNPVIVEQVEGRIAAWIADGYKDGVIIFERFAVEWKLT